MSKRETEVKKWFFDKFLGDGLIIAGAIVILVPILTWGWAKVAGTAAQHGLNIPH